MSGAAEEVKAAAAAGAAAAAAGAEAEAEAEEAEAEAEAQAEGEAEAQAEAQAAAEAAAEMAAEEAAEEAAAWALARRSVSTRTVLRPVQPAQPRPQPPEQELAFRAGEPLGPKPEGLRLPTRERGPGLDQSQVRPQGVLGAPGEREESPRRPRQRSRGGAPGSPAPNGSSLSPASADYVARRVFGRGDGLRNHPFGLSG